MSNDFQMIKSISAIYRCAFSNVLIHKNTMRNRLIYKGKISTRNKFYQAFDKLVNEGGLLKDKDFVSINPAFVKTGVMQQEDENTYFVFVPETDGHYRISKSVASGYKDGDQLNVIIENIAGNSEAIILGKKKDETFVENTKRSNIVREDKLEKENLFLGRVVKISHDDLVFIPNRKNLPVRQVPILNSKEEYAKFQDKICIMKLEDKNDMSKGGTIVEVKGEAGNPIHEYDAIAESYGAIMDWSGAKLKREIDKIPTSVDVGKLKLISENEAKTKKMAGQTVDLRHIPFATVDPATCKDMDDAIYSTFNENGDIVCYVAVANVTKYVDLRSEIGKKYIQGGFTVYAPNKAYNILPSQLSTGICSLNPNEDRLAFVVKATIDKKTGKVKKSKIYDALISSRRKYSYEEAQKIVDDKSEDFTMGYLMSKFLRGEVLTEDEQVVMNYYSAKLIKRGFEERGMIRFVANKEREVVFDEDLQNVLDIKQIPHLYYHEVIEAFMITANEVTAKYAQDHNLDNIYRVHDEPNPQKLNRAIEFFDILGIDFDGDLSAEGTRELLEIIEGGIYEEIINTFLIKMQSRALYSDHPYSEEDDEYMEGEQERISHYALQSPHYSHTTSPIRRLPDYITQYNILAHIHGKEPISLSALQKIVEIANSRQIDVDQAERDFEDINSAIYCEKHIGEKLSGRITKIRMATPEEGYEDDIIVIVKDQEKGIHAEIPLSQIIGRESYDCQLSQFGCAVYDKKGNAILTLCKPLDFIIESADRKTMKVVGRACRQVDVKKDKFSSVHTGRQSFTRDQVITPANYKQRERKSRELRIKNKLKNDGFHIDDDENYK